MKNRNFTILFLILLPFLAVSAPVAVGVLQGKALDQLTSIPIAGVKVTIENATGVTNEMGVFEVRDVPVGRQMAVLEKDGYKPQHVPVTIEENKTTNMTIELKFSTMSLPEALIVADKPRSAASSTVLNALDFDMRPRNSAQDMMRAIPGVIVAQHAGGGKAEQTFIRGFDCDHGTDIAGFVDGIPVNMPSHGHGQGYMDLHFVIPEAVKTIDVFKGTYFAELGDFATGGAVLFKTLDKLESNLVQVEIGSVTSNRAFAHSRELIMYQLPITNDKISSYVVAENIYSPSYFIRDQKFSRESVNSKTIFDLGNDQSLTLLLTAFNSHWNASGQIPERAVADGSITRYGSEDPTEGGHTNRENISLTYKKLAGSSKFEAQAYAFHYAFSLFSDFTFYRDDMVNGDEIHQTDDRKVVGLNLKQTYTSDKNKFTIGGMVRYDDIENRNNHVMAQQYLNTIAHSFIKETNVGVYVKDEYPLSPKWSAEVGLRFNYIYFNVTDLLPSDSIQQNYTGTNYQVQVAPKFNLIYTPSKEAKFFFNAGEGFHSNDARAEVQLTSDIKHRLPSAFAAEIGTQLHPFGPGTIISAALWGMELQNELVFNGDDGVTADNGTTRRIGLDAGIRSGLTKWLFADFDVNLSKNNLTKKLFGPILPKDNLIPLAPTFTSTGSLTFRFPEGWEGSLRYRYLGPRAAVETNAVITRGYTVVDANLFYKKNHYKIGVTMENLFNVNWNEAQFDTTSQLRGEAVPVEELNFTPGTPFAIKLIVGYKF